MSPKRRSTPVKHDADDPGLPPESAPTSEASPPRGHLTLVCPECRRASISTFVPIAELPDGTLVECARRPGCGRVFEVKQGALVKIG